MFHLPDTSKRLLLVRGQCCLGKVPVEMDEAVCLATEGNGITLFLGLDDAC